MKKIPSIASIEQKKAPCDNGELPKALDVWFRFAPKDSHWWRISSEEMESEPVLEHLPRRRVLAVQLGQPR